MKFIIGFLCLLIAVSAHAQVRLPGDFVFGVATAPGQVEDKLDDIWIDWGRAGHIHGWPLAANPEERLQFWTHPEIELDLAQQLGVGAFRMGVDWGRLMPTRNTFDAGALEHYRMIIKLARARNMKVMVTLWHHSLPKWVQDSDGWHNSQNRDAFVVFAKHVITDLHDDVSWWATFNEANVFALNAYTSGIWPPGEHHSPLAMLPLLGGSSVKAIDLMASAHNEIYDWAHQAYPQIQLGLAHNMARYKGRGLVDKLTARFADSSMNWHLPQMVKGHLDFFGINYYGSEWLDGQGIGIYPEEEYSDAGRAIDPNGLLATLRLVSKRYPGLPILITENGIADADDNLRSAYLIEHLAAVERAIAEKISVKAFFEWTLTDNLEWSDGYCPRFGLVDIDRNTMIRTPRSSFYVYQKIAASKSITKQQRTSAWARVVAMRGRTRPFCRAPDGATGLDRAIQRPYSSKDWRFTAPQTPAQPSH